MTPPKTPMPSVRYQLHCLDNPPRGEFSPEWALSGLTGDQLWAAHDMAHLMLSRSPQSWDRYLYKGGPNRIELPIYTSCDAYVDLSIEKLDYKSLLAISEICQTLRCTLRPLDGGPEIAADPQSLVQDLMRRAQAALSPHGQPLSEVIEAAQRAKREAHSRACAEARAIRESGIKRRKPAVPAGEAAQSVQAPH